MKNICKNCGKEYEYEPKRGTYKFQYCSSECKHEYAKKDAEPQMRVCEYCHKEYWWDGQLRNYEGNIYVDTKRFCSLECGKAYKYEKIKEIKIEKYGAAGLGSKEIVEKAKKTKLERYGSVGYNNREKAKQTCLEKYGTENVSQSEQSKQKLKEYWTNMSEENFEKLLDKRHKTCLERYGVDSASKTEQFKEKTKQTNIEKYGVEYYTQTEEYKQRYKETCLEKYGVEHATQNPEISDKISKVLLNKTEEEWSEIINKRKDTNIEKYGVEFASQSSDIREKIKQTNFDRYGNEVALRSDSVQEKIKVKNIEKYGVEYSIGSKEVQEKIRNTNLERHGYEYPFQSQELREIMEENRKKTNLKRYGSENIIHIKEFKEKAIQTCLEKYGVPYNCMSKNCMEANFSTISKINLNFKKKLDKYKIKNKLEFCLKNYNYDFLCEDNVLVEINPSFTHSSSENDKVPFFIRPKNQNYHFNKTKVALENGYTCIHVWDWDDEDKILNMLKNKEKMYARKLAIKEVSLEDTTSFLNTYHLQNTCKGQEIRLGLFKDDELIQLMTFGKPRYNKKYQYELLRLCTKAEYKVIGGAEKLFKYFIKTYNPESIISYCDNSKFKGDVYKRLGMKLLNFGNPRRHWYNSKTERHITDSLLLQRGYSQLHNDKEHVKGESNQLLMLEAGYLEIYDCGQSTYVWCAS